ncbi:ABC transporter substrate-binding protein [Tepidiforma sp.]|uniref:ABC transporter substrate-binding protein n=1 Tax=Tepidiforma sp. TaxID=2682230 RepID=UPI0026090A09|nr:ABC transporter substrate-binding protein [Tepidiforma sp.]MCX7617884.1 ABC transporter substrate-binding protein [Tepidiforma sp.]
MKRWFLLAAGLAAALFAGALLSACGGDDDDDGGGLTPVTFMLNWTPNTYHSGVYIALERGWYREAGLDVKIIEPAAGGTAQVLAAGKADFGIMAQEEVIPARAEGVPVVALAALIQHNDSSLYFLKSEGITRPRDLEGKTYGGFGGVLERQLISELVKCDGGDPSKVKFVEVGNVDYLAGMESNRFDFVWVFEFWDVLRAREVEKKDVGSLKFIDYTNCIPDWYTPLLVTSEQLIKEKPDVVRKFMEATVRGYEVAMQDPQAAADAIMKGAPESDRRLLEVSAVYLSTRYVDPGRPWGLQDREVWVTFTEYLRRAGLIDKEIDVDAAFTNEFLPKR